MPQPDPRQRQSSRPVALTTIIGGHLEKVLSSDVFKAAERLRELLRFTVRETMAGRGGELKEYLLAVSVLGKADSFDPKADPVVRIQMRRLREHLDRYYATEGQYDPVRIQIPKGTYMPTFATAARGGAVAVAACPEEKLIVGRQKELANLRAAFEGAAGGRGRLLCLSGEPGIGKTILVDTFLRELATSDLRYCLARGRCSERLAGSEAYLPVLEALETLLRDGDEWVSRLMEVVAPTWYAQIAPLTQQAPAGGKPIEQRAASQERLKRELVAFLEELARRHPVVMFLDDLHWADPSTIDILAYAAPRCASQPILIVGAYRPPELRVTEHPFLRVKLELQGHDVCHEIPMEFLSAADVDRYLALRFPEHAFPAELSARVHDRTEGNPLFMTDLVGFLRDRGVLAEHEGRWVMLGELSDIEKELPESIRSMVERKIGQLSDADHRLLVAASVQRHEFDSAVLSRTLRADAAQVEERLDALEHIHGFVSVVGEKELPDRTLTTRYRFVHVLYQNALYASLRPTRRGSLSAAVAEALLAHFGTHRSAIASEVAMLFEAARDFERAAEHFLMAARQAADISANTEAAALARRGLEAIKLLPKTPERAAQELRLQTTLGPALMGTVGFGAPEVEAVYSRARELCREIGDTPQLFPVVWGLWQYSLARGEYQSAQELAAQLLTWAQRLHDPELMLMGHHAVGNTCWLIGEFEPARTQAEQNIALYVPAQHHALAARYGGYDTGVANRCGLALNLWPLGYPDHAVQIGGEAIALARHISHAYSVSFALTFDAMLHQFRRDVERTRQRAEAAMALAAEHELAPWLAWSSVLRGWAIAEQGQAEEGIVQIRQGISGWRAGGSGCLVPYFLALLAEAYANVGHSEDALTTVGEALAITAQTREGLAEAELYRLQGELQSEPANAQRFFQRAIDVARRQRAKSWELRAVMSLSRLYERQGRRTEARQMLAQVYDWFTEGFDTADLKEAAALLEYFGVSRSEPNCELSG